MKLSVLIPSYSRKEWLLKTLGYIALQTRRDFEVIIVDASAAEDQLSESEVTQFSFPLNYIRYGIVGNISKQRNIALKAANGDILLFLDDDVSFENDLFEKYVQLFATGNYSAISGLTETAKYRRGAPPLDYQDNRLFKIGALNYMACDFEVESHVICTANFALTRETYLKAGGFDEYMYGVFDDIHYGFKLSRAGIRVMHHPLVSVFHYQVKASGARSTDLPPWWRYYNMIYYHLKNLKPNRAGFFLSVSWSVFHPSRRWLKITTLPGEYYQFCKAFAKASKNASAA